MTPRLLFRPEARAELLEAQVWYEERAVGLGQEFARAIEAAIATIARTPRRFPAVHGEVRRALLRRFPYQLLYRLEADGDILIVACFHHRRDPARWQQRG